MSQQPPLWFAGRRGACRRAAADRRSTGGADRKLVADPATGEKLTAIGLEPLPGSTPDSFAAYAKTEVDRWAVVVRKAGVELD